MIHNKKNAYIIRDTCMSDKLKSINYKKNIYILWTHGIM